MQAHELLARHGEHAERIIVAQIRLQRERKSGNVGELLQVGRAHAGCIELFAEMRDLVVSALQSALQALELQRLQLRARHAFEIGLEHRRRFRSDRLLAHGVLPLVYFGKAQPGLTPEPAAPLPRTGVCSSAKP